jgi:prepilin-type N-terminal cleavage/methylation domain-containing protein
MKRGVSLIELLISIAIVGILVQLLFPAIQASREAARRIVCQSNLKQISLAFQHHLDTYGYYPSSGWGWQWVGSPTRGYGKDQPGGWAYNILPFVEEQVLRDMGRGLPEGSNELERALLQVNATPIPLFNCPSKRLPQTFPVVTTDYANDVIGFSPLLPKACRDGDGNLCRVARSDYAANSGNINPGREPGPNSIGAAITWEWKYSGSSGLRQNGVTHQRSQVKAAQIIDGTTQTYCLGEKYIPVEHYDSGKWQNDDLSVFAAHDGDNNRYTADPYDSVRLITPDTEPSKNQHFGAAHPMTFSMAFCDGSVRAIPYSIEPEIHRLLGGRDDGVGSHTEMP